MKILLLKEQFVICNQNPSAALPAWLNYRGYGFISRTPHELSIICSEAMAPKHAQTENGWRCLKIEKPQGTAVRITRADIVIRLSNAGLRTFTLSTYGNDYLLFKEADLAELEATLKQQNYEIELEQ